MSSVVVTLLCAGVQAQQASVDPLKMAIVVVVLLVGLAIVICLAR